MRLTLIVAAALALTPAALDRTSRGTSGPGYGRLRREKEAEESKSSKGRVPEGRARHRPERTEKIGSVTAPSPRS